MLPHHCWVLFHPRLCSTVYPPCELQVVEPEQDPADELARKARSRLNAGTTCVLDAIPTLVTAVSLWTCLVTASGSCFLLKDITLRTLNLLHCCTIIAMQLCAGHAPVITRCIAGYFAVVMCHARVVHRCHPRCSDSRAVYRLPGRRGSRRLQPMQLKHVLQCP